MPFEKYSTGRDGVASATTVAAATGGASDPNIDASARPLSFCVLCKRHRAESADLPCLGGVMIGPVCARADNG